MKGIIDCKNHCKKALVLVQLGIKAVPLSFHKQSKPCKTANRHVRPMHFA